jgi:hypothetical protein
MRAPRAGMSHCGGHDNSFSKHGECSPPDTGTYKPHAEVYDEPLRSPHHASPSADLPTLIQPIFEALATGNPPPCPALTTLRLLRSHVWGSKVNLDVFE